jgi:hypothetical protein
MVNMARILRVAMAAIAIPSVAHGQYLRLAPADAVAPRRADSVRAKPAPWFAPLASLAVPGLGQAFLRQSRALPYIAVEVYAVLEYRAQRTEGLRGENQYRSLADGVARKFFGGTRPTNEFEYYESMEKFVESGSFDRIPGGDIDPEVDETTFNGTIWRLARETFWEDPAVAPPTGSAAYRSAVSLYLQRAVNSDFQWSWRDAALEHDLYRRSIRRSNDAYRRARQQLGVILANHLLAMADAFATIRVRSLSSASSGWALSVELPLPHRD